MTDYHVNKRAQPTGEHEVHTAECLTPADPENRISLGDFQSCSLAVAEAKKHFNNVDGCRNCSIECHTR